MYDFVLIFRTSPTREPAAPMALTREQIESIAALARLELTGAEVPVYQESLSRILDFVGALDRADTGSVTP
ncbi:MAG TPA: Asp-tRNA(Asn)/Glu-tRNA(Gln) amidotransferase subunit GatC, partial [Steroidobacteraceae bacterium]|nr:Asp-tRNA(Asn)/Glu-tRNA(Gln) amidotransferase subunit GatC [Steroidobacteraceae bacterium]